MNKAALIFLLVFFCWPFGFAQALDEPAEAKVSALISPKESYKWRYGLGLVDSWQGFGAGVARRITPNTDIGITSGNTYQFKDSRYLFIAHATFYTNGTSSNDFRFFKPRLGYSNKREQAYAGVVERHIGLIDFFVGTEVRYWGLFASASLGPRLAGDFRGAAYSIGVSLASELMVGVLF